MHSDSIEGIYSTLRQCALISKAAGGIGLNVHNIRAKGSYIAGVSTDTFLLHCTVNPELLLLFLLQQHFSYCFRLQALGSEDLCYIISSSD